MLFIILTQYGQWRGTVTVPRYLLVPIVLGTLQKQWKFRKAHDPGVHQVRFINYGRQRIKKNERALRYHPNRLLTTNLRHQLPSRLPKKNENDDLR